MATITLIDTLGIGFREFMTKDARLRFLPDFAAWAAAPCTNALRNQTSLSRIGFWIGLVSSKRTILA